MVMQSSVNEQHYVACKCVLRARKMMGGTITSTVVDVSINKNDKDGLKHQLEGLCNVIETCSRRQYVCAK